MAGPTVPFTIGTTDITIAVAYTGAATAAKNILGGNPAVRIINNGTDYVFIIIGSDNTVGAPVVPTDGSNQVGFLVAPSSIEVLTLQANCWIRAISLSGGSGTLYFSRGNGI